jgi:hypothetical protein
MKSVYGFVVRPLGSRYNNTKSVGDKELIVNSENFNHQFVNREAEVISCPIINNNMGINPGDIVVLHHNVFRRWEDQYGNERNSKNYFHEDMYIVYQDQIFLFKSQEKWKAPKGYCFIQPIKDNKDFAVEKEKPLMGVVKYSDGTVDVGDLVGFRPSSEYEFIIEGKRLYRVMSNFITIKYEYQGDEEEYNPSWA